MKGFAQLSAFLLAASLIILIPGPAAPNAAGRAGISPDPAITLMTSCHHLNSADGIAPQRQSAWGLLLCSGVILAG